jgi:hypothetical protein
MAFLVKKPEVSPAELIEYYEQHDVPLITSLAGHSSTDATTCDTTPPPDHRTTSTS